MSNFQNLKLSTTILNALTKKGYTIPTPIQSQAIPHLLAGKDLLGIAQTGTGKTAAFALPILDNLSKSNKKVSPNNVRTLILTPTRELASQIVNNIKLYGQDFGLKFGVIFGGVSINNQIKASKQGFDILVATPARLLDLINQKHLTFSQLEIFVLDEADRMLDMGFIGDVRKIIAKLPKQRHSLFFSATMPKDVSNLANSILNNPVRIEVTPESTTVEKIDQRVNLVEKANKSLLLQSIIEQGNDDDLFLVFSKTKHGANRIMEFLEKQSIKVAVIHGNKSQSAREKALEGFKQGKLKALIATDIAARGIDIVGITYVINFDIPNHPESYVHRIGRTARAGSAGIAISFCDNSEKDLIKDIEKLIKIKLPIDETHPFHGVKASPATKSSLDIRDITKSGYKTLPKPRFVDERKPSYFSQNRRWKSDGDGRKPKFDTQNREERFDFADRKPKNNEGDYGARKPRFDSSNGGERDNYRGNDYRFKNRDSKPNFIDNKRGFEGRSSKSSFSDNKDRHFDSRKKREDNRVGRVFFADRNSNSVKKFYSAKKFGNKNSKNYSNITNNPKPTK